MTAFYAKIPAANITSGFDVLVQDVIAAITTDPWVSSYSSPLNVNLEVVASLSWGILYPLNPTGAVKHD